MIEVLIRAYQYWIENVGVDGYRFDTAIYVDHEFWHRFMHGGQGVLQGIYPFAEKTGREGFYTFGETWISSQPFDDQAEKDIKAYVGTPQKPEMDAVLNFPLQQSIKRVFADGEPTDQLTYRILSLQRHFPNTTSLVNFIDNHDMARFRAYASEESYQQALLFLLSIPGMPVIYQGTEQGEKEVREPLFDKLDTASKEFLLVKKLVQFRKENPLTRHGKVEILADSKHCPGLLLYRLVQNGEELYAAYNTGENTILTGGLFLKNDADANQVEEVLSLRGGSEWVLENGNLSLMKLPPKAGTVFKIKSGKIAERAAPSLQVLNPNGANVQSPAMTLNGSVDAADSVFIFFDGNFERKTNAKLDGKKWQADIDLNNTSNGRHFWQAAALKNGQLSIFPKIDFTLELPEMKRASVNDPIGDDNGPDGRYEYPTDPTFGRQMDIKSATAYSTGNNLRLEVEMAHPFSTVWNPLNGFDHMLLMAFIDLPAQRGTGILPKINNELPVGEEWDYAVTLGGWSVSAFKAEGSTATEFGAAAPKPVIKVSPEKNTLQLQFPASALGNLTTLQGAKIYLYTWDGGGEGELRPLLPQAESFSFGGGKKGDPMFMDEVRLVLE